MLCYLCCRLRKSKEQELESLLSTTNNPQSLQFLMEQMKQNAAGLSSLQFNIGKAHNVTLDEREIGMSTRESQLKGEPVTCGQV